MTRKVHLISSDSGSRQILRARGWDIVKDIDPETFIWFSGGADISPELYGEPKHPTTSFYAGRDTIEVDYFKRYPKNPKLGICRGAQLCCALSGGKLYQDVNGHFGSHKVLDHDTGSYHLVSSVHHQMMILPPGSHIIATCGLSTQRDTAKKRHYVDVDFPINSDIEVAFIPSANALCFQGHPEFGPKECTDYFFELVDRYYPEN